MISETFTGSEKFQASMRAIQDPAARLQLFREIGAALKASVQQRFIEERGPDGKPWRQSLRARTEGGQTLRDTSRLFGSITYNAAPDKVEIGSNVIYARIHQLGGTIKPKSKKYLSFVVNGRRVFLKKVTLPARPFLGINAEDEREIEATVEDWFAGQFQ